MALRATKVMKTPGYLHRTAAVKEYAWPWGPRNRMKTCGCLHRTATVRERRLYRRLNGAFSLQYLRTAVLTNGGRFSDGPVH